MRRSNISWISRLLASCVAVVILAAVLWVNINPRAFVKFMASYSVGRPVSFGKLTYSVEHPLKIEMDDIHIANQSWGSAPDFMHIGHLSAELDEKTFWSFKPSFLHLSMNDASLLLERNEDGLGNWQKRGITFRLKRSPEKEASYSRRHFPTILDLVLSNSRIVFHTSGGKFLDIYFKNLSLETTAKDQPVTLSVDGAYNETPVHLNIQTQSYDALYDTRHPFSAKIAAQGEATALELNLDLMDPINFDQFRGRFHGDIKNIGKAATYLGSPFHADLPLNFESTFERQGDNWTFKDLCGNLADSLFANSKLSITEGARLQSDSIKMGLDFSELNLTTLGVETGEGKESYLSNLKASNNPSTLLDVLITSKEATYHSVTAYNLTAHGTLNPGDLSLDNLGATLFDGSLQAEAHSKGVTTRNEFSAKIDLSHIDIAQFFQAMKAKEDILRGRANLELAATAFGDTELDLEKTTVSHMTFTMGEGQISRKLILLASTDIRLLFAGDQSYVPLTDLGAQLDVKSGLGTLSSFQLDTTAGVLVGSGTVDLPQKTLDLAFHTVPKTTSWLALDIPVHVKGPIDDPTIKH